MTTSTSSSRRGRGTPRSAPASTTTTETVLREELGQYRDTVQLLTEQLQEATSQAWAEAGVPDLERQIVADPGWRRWAIQAEQEFTPEGMVKIRQVCRLMAIANPLIKRGLSLRSHYIWGQGCEITARANGKNRENTKEQDVAAVITAHIDDPANQRAVWGQQAREENERALGTDGEVFIALFTKPRSGWVQARTVIADEITDVITNPEDIAEPWYYRRRWQMTGYDDHGQQVPSVREVLYPDVDYQPRSQPKKFAGIEVLWDAPMVHVPVNRPKGWLRGIPDAYAALNWGRAYKEFLEQWSRLMASLAKFAWRLTAEGSNRTQAKQALAAAGQSRNPLGDPNNVGGTAITPIGANLEAIPKSGATIDAESGRPLAMMVAAALDLPVTMLLADPGQTGARATAETLDWPTELAMMARQQLWTAAQLRILRYVITESVRASQGVLKGTVKRDPVTDREVTVLAGDTDDTIDVVFPPLDEVDPKAVIDAVVAANATGTLPPELVLQLILAVLGVRDTDSIMEKMVDEQGQFVWPQTPQTAVMGPGQQAADLARAGGDPAQIGPGSMGPDGAPMPEPDQGAPAGPVDPNDQQAATEAIADGVTAEAYARQADADFGLFGGTGADSADGQDSTSQGSTVGQGDDTGEPDDYDPSFYQL